MMQRAGDFWCSIAINSRRSQRFRCRLARSKPGHCHRQRLLRRSSFAGCMCHRRNSFNSESGYHTRHSNTITELGHCNYWDRVDMQQRLDPHSNSNVRRTERLMRSFMAYLQVLWPFPSRIAHKNWVQWLMAATDSVQSEDWRTID